MALIPNTTADSLYSTYKEWYAKRPVQSLLYRNSPMLKISRKEKVAGKYYVTPMMTSRGGAVSGDMTISEAIAAANGTATSQVAQVPYAMTFSTFYITEAEILTSTPTEGAFTPVSVQKLYAASDAMRKTFAAGAYGLGFGELGQLPTAVTSGSTTMSLNFDTIIKMDLGTLFYVSSTTDPGSSQIGSTGNIGNTQSLSTVFKVTAIAGTTVTYTPAAPTGGFPQYSWLELVGGRDANGAGNMQTGLRGWLPTHYNRTGGSWNTYIGTSFFNLARQQVPDRMAGAFYLQGTVSGSEPKIAALKYGVQYARRQGGVPDAIVVNDSDLAQILEEIRANTTYYQSINNNAEKGSANEVVVGLQQVDVQFSTSWLKYFIEDPYCPLGMAYILDRESFGFVHMNSIQKQSDDGVAPNEPGRAEVTSVSSPEFNFKLFIDEWMNVQPVSVSQGPAAKVNLVLYGNWVHWNPADSSVVKFSEINSQQF